MGVLKKGLPASTLMECLVAAVILMVVFLAGMEVMVRIAGRQDSGEERLSAEQALRQCLVEYRDGRRPSGERNYEWGKILVTVVPYRDKVQLLTLTAVLDSDGFRIQYKHLIGL